MGSKLPQKDFHLPKGERLTQVCRGMIEIYDIPKILVLWLKEISLLKLFINLFGAHSDAV